MMISTSTRAVCARVLVLIYGYKPRSHDNILYTLAYRRGLCILCAGKPAVSMAALPHW